jgi:DUF1009 family protein
MMTMRPLSGAATENFKLHPMTPENAPAGLGLIAGSGDYPLLLARAARAAGVAPIVAAAFEHETDPALIPLVDEIGWLRVGQLGRLLAFFQQRGVGRAIMAGQIAPKNLFDLRPDFKALLLLGKLRERNAASLFGAIADELAKAGVFLLPATTYLEHFLAGSGHLAGPAPGRRQWDDVAFAMRVARQVSALDIGQSVVVRHGTVLAVEAFEGTDRAIERGGALAGKGGAVLAKVSKPDQDFRFDVPVIGTRTLETAARAKLSVVAVETGKTLLLEPARIAELAQKHRISVVGYS